MLHPKLDNQRGWSMMELLVAMTIAGVATALALMNFGIARQKVQRENLARDFNAQVEKVRADSVRRRATTTAAMSRLEITSRTSYNVIADYNFNGAIDSGEVRGYTFPANGPFRFYMTGTTPLPVSIRFDWRGMARITNGVGTTLNNPTISVIEQTDGRDPSSLTSHNATTLALTSGGDTSITSGAASATTYSTPQTTSVNANNGVRSSASVNNSNNTTYSY